MKITEERRHQMYSKLEAVLGHDDATMLMEHLPPLGWGDVATTRDLDQGLASLRLELRADLAETETRLSRAILTGIVASNVTIGALAFAAAHLT